MKAQLSVCRSCHRGGCCCGGAKGVIPWHLCGCEGQRIAAVFPQEVQRAVEKVAYVVGQAGVDDVAKTLLAEIAILENALICGFNIGVSIAGQVLAFVCFYLLLFAGFLGWLFFGWVSLTADLQHSDIQTAQ